MTTATLKVLGVSDEVNTCGCCGRADLKRTVAVGTGEGDVRYFGTDCAATILATSGKQIEKDVRTAKKNAAAEAAREQSRKANEEWAAYDAWKLATFGDTTNNLDRRRMYRSAMGL